MSQRILVWDIPTRLFHWTLVLSFAGAFLTSETERYRDLHLVLGYLMLGLIVFRLIWGLIGTRYARFSSFLFSPRATLDYVKSLLQGHPSHYLGHNPAGAVAILLVLALGLLICLSGVALDLEFMGEMFEESHETLAYAMLTVVFLHIAGVVVSSRLHGENLVRAMLTGYKSGTPEQGIARPFAWLGGIMALIIAAGLMLYQPVNSAANGVTTTQHIDD